MIAVLVMLSVILTVSVLFPDKTNETVILAILVGGSVLALIAAIASGALKRLPLIIEGPRVWNRGGCRRFRNSARLRCPARAEFG